MPTYLDLLLDELNTKIYEQVNKQTLDLAALAAANR